MFAGIHLRAGWSVQSGPQTQTLLKMCYSFIEYIEKREIDHLSISFSLSSGVLLPCVVVLLGSDELKKQRFAPAPVVLIPRNIQQNPANALAPPKKQHKNRR